MPSVSLSPSTRRLLSKLRAVWSDHDADGYLTGGFLRDLLLDREARDIDVALAGDAPALARLAANAVGGACFALDDERGITRIVLPARAAVAYIDVTRLRGDIESDLAERDFTIDAMALPLETVGRRGPQALVIRSRASTTSKTGRSGRWATASSAAMASACCAPPVFAPSSTSSSTPTPRRSFSETQPASTALHRSGSATNWFVSLRPIGLRRTSASSMPLACWSDCCRRSRPVAA